MASGLAMCYNPARSKDARLPGYGGLGEGGGVAGARSPESRGAGARAQGVRMRARGRRGGAERGGGGGGGGGCVGVVIFVARTVRGGARVVVGKYPGWPVWGRTTPQPAVADLGERAPAAGSSPRLGSEPGARAARPGCARVARATRTAWCRFPARHREDRSPPRPRSLHGPGSMRTRLQGEAGPWSCEARRVRDARLLLGGVAVVPGGQC